MQTFDFEYSAALLAAGLLILGAASCSDDDGSTQGDTGETITDTGTPDDTGEPGDTADAGTDAADSSSENRDGDSGSPPPVSRFEYEKETVGCNRNCTDGVRVNIQGGFINKLQDQAQGEQQALSDSDIEDLRQNFLTEEVADKQENGWDCGDSTTYNGATHLFESLPGDAGFDEDPDRNTVAGCVNPETEQPDDELVRDLIDKLQSLENKYFSDD